MGICRPCLLNQKYGTVSPKKFCRSAQSRCFTYRNKNLSKVLILQQGVFVLILSCHFRQVFVCYLMAKYKYHANKQVARFIKYSLGSSPSLRLVQKRNRPENFIFIATNNRVVLAIRWSVKYFLLRITQYTPFCVCMKGKTLCDCLRFSSCCDFASLIRNIGEFGAKNYFTGHRTSNTIKLFVPIKRKFFRSILFQKGRLINIATCLFAHY